MARQTIETFVDDLDGSDRDIRTVHLALDGKQVEIDLSPKNRAALERTLGKYFKNGRSASRGPGRPRGSTPKAPAKKSGAGRRGAPTLPKYDRQAFLVWAKQKGYRVPARGRTKTAWIQEFLKDPKKRAPSGPSRRTSTRAKKAGKKRASARRSRGR